MSCAIFLSTLGNASGSCHVLHQNNNRGSKTSLSTTDNIKVENGCETLFVCIVETVTNARVFIIYSESEMFVFEVMFSCRDRNPTVETVKVLHHAEQLLFINKHKHSRCKTIRKIRQIVPFTLHVDHWRYVTSSEICFDIYECLTDAVDVNNRPYFTHKSKISILKFLRELK